MSGFAVERAELAVGDADVRVVRIRVDHERDATLGDSPEPDLLGERADLEQRRLDEKPAAVLAIETVARQDLVADALERQFHTRTTL
jgi:hypothetical protein